jgi:hypothetical protein
MKFKFCSQQGKDAASFMEDKDILIILAIFCIILGGMCIAFLCKIVKKLVHDHKIIKVRLFIYKELGTHSQG